MKFRTTISALLLVSMFMTGVRPALSQTFKITHEIILPDSLEKVLPEAIDVDNDGLIDLMLLSKTYSGNAYLLFVRGDTANGPALIGNSVAVPDFESYAIRDFNMDNQLDVLLSFHEGGSGKTVVLLNNGDFVFENRAINLPAFNVIGFSDLNQDGNPDCVLSGDDGAGNAYTSTFTRKSAFDWALQHDTLGLSLSSLEILDLDGNAIPDVFMSGHNDSGDPFSMLLTAKEGKFTKQFESSHLVQSLICDVDVNGVLDIVAFGKSSSGVPVYEWYNASNGFEAKSIAATGNLQSAFHADLNSDGTPDNAFWRIEGNDTLNIIRFTGGAEQLLTHKGLRNQQFFDMDQDGDLDLIQLSQTGSLSVTLLENQTPARNLGPSKMTAFAFPVYDRVLLYWTGTTDDHTPAYSLTYDVLLEGSNVSRDISFDLQHGKRLRSQHGNNGTQNFYLLANEGQSFGYAIQAVDNSLYANPGGICFGNGFNCDEVKHEKITACTKEQIVLTAPEQALWFSFSSGFLGQGISLDYQAEKKDTVFYLVPQEACPVVTTFEFEIDDSVQKTESETMYICNQKDVTLSVNTSWENIAWNSEKQGELGNTASVVYRSDQDDLVTAIYRNEEGCAIEKTFTLLLSVPAIKALPETVRIMKGQTIELSASGGEQYSWSPAEGLSNPGIANPVASPVQDVSYTVTGVDSVGCQGAASVMVFVESTGFIPSLFTPNGDGQNDVLKVYGLSGVESFSLKIFNREGSMVYSATSASQAIGEGWNGATNGVSQPNGVYFWKVDGKLPSGKRLLLNGKEEGSLVLLR